MRKATHRKVEEDKIMSAIYVIYGKVKLTSGFRRTLISDLLRQ